MVRTHYWLILFLLFIATPAYTQTSPAATINFSAPATGTRGEVLNPALLTYRVYSGTPGTPAAAKTPVASGSGSPIVVPGASVGQKTCFHVTAIYTGNESAPSGEACLTVTPNSPGNVVITIVVTTQ